MLFPQCCFTPSLHFHARRCLPPRIINRLLLLESLKWGSDQRMDVVRSGIIQGPTSSWRLCICCIYIYWIRPCESITGRNVCWLTHSFPLTKILNQKYKKKWVESLNINISSFNQMNRSCLKIWQILHFYYFLCDISLGLLKECACFQARSRILAGNLSERTIIFGSGWQYFAFLYKGDSLC